MADLGFEEADEEGENFLETQSSDNNYMVGFVLANVVGLQYYTGTINGREMIRLVREPENRYDPNAIKVLNMSGQQVGHIERSVALALASHVDQSLILIEGIVSRALHKGAYKLPCQIYIFSHRDSMGMVLQLLKGAGLNVITAEDQEFLTAESIAAKETYEDPGVKEVRRVDDIFGSLNNPKKRQSMEACELVTSTLLQHQKEALAWMVQRENSSELPPFWDVCDKTSKSQQLRYKNVLTNFETNGRPKPLRGGILADDMGLGKTLSLLSLIATNRPGAKLPPVVDIAPSSESSDAENPKNPDSDNFKNPNTENPKSPNRKGAKRKRSGSDGSRSVTMGKGQAHKSCQEIVFEPPDPDGPRATLVVCPPSVLSNWVDQLEEHTKRGSLKVYLYHGGGRMKEANEISKFDIVLTTYSTLGSELNNLSSPIKEIKWLRIILDEAHFIKNAGTKQAKAAIALNAERRWAVTGTPIQNTAFDLFTLMAFLHFEPFSIKSYWNSLVQRPLSQGNKSGCSRLQALLETVALRRTKDMKINGQCLVELPPKYVQIHPVELSHEERELYNNVETEGRKVVQNFINSGTVLHNYSSILQIILRLRQICDDASLCPSDVESLFSSFKLEDASGDPNLLKKLLSVLQAGDDFDCPVCLSPPSEAIITICSHVFCKKCIEKTLKHLKPQCPLCRKQLTASDLFSSPKVADENEVTSEKVAKTGSKINALIALLKESQDHDPTTKSVVFSQFRKMLDLLQEPLEKSGFKFVRLDGSMPPKKRAASITAFMSNKPGSPTILLASLKAAGVGINLTAASDVYMFDPWWNPAVEDQAMDRIHRIGQTRSVRVLRLVVKDSIEERILEMQDGKRKLASSAFKDKSDKEQRKMRVEDVQRLMRLS